VPSFSVRMAPLAGVRVMKTGAVSTAFLRFETKSLNRHGTSRCTVEKVGGIHELSS
jgi:hypothetical protein